jgi:hypothetical protein
MLAHSDGLIMIGFSKKAEIPYQRLDWRIPCGQTGLKKSKIALLFG